MIATSPLAACNRADEAGNAASANASEGTPALSSETVAAALDGNGDFDTLHDLSQNAGLNDALSGTGPYTLFAPTDAAFEALGDERVGALKGAEMRPQAMALLRAHIVPGVVTRRDLDAALGSGRPAQLRTMAGGTLTFTREGDAIVVAAADGARARLSGDGTNASNGAIHPVDGLLLRSDGAAR